MFWNFVCNVIIVLVSVFILFCFYGKWKHRHYIGTGVKFINPPLPFIGNNGKSLVGLEHMTQYVKGIYNYYPDQKYIGVFEGLRPMIILRDLELIKMICIKDFDMFHDHRSMANEEVDMFGKSILNMHGQSWRDMRATLSPAFSSSKMRNMFHYINKCAENTCEYYKEKLDSKGMDIMDIEVKDEFSKYTIDSIATSAFGIEINSMKDTKNDFFRMGKAATYFSIIQLLRFMLMISFPNLMKKFKIGLGFEKVTNFFTSLVKNSMKTREENKLVRYDMIHLLMESKKGSLVHDKLEDKTTDTGFSTVEESTIGKSTVNRFWDDDYLAAQAYVFFLGGFDTTSSGIAFFLYEIAKAPEIQKKIQNEIDEFKNKSNEEFIYDDIHKLKYLDMCVSESLRKWPPGIALDRMCTKNYTLPPPSEESDKTYEIKVGESIWIPVYGIHHDPKYYPNPEKFDPERFSDENISNINQFSYMPFGRGPRNCIGSRYALMVFKAILFHFLSRFDIVVTKRTEIPLRLANSPFTLQGKNGIWLGLKKRT